MLKKGIVLLTGILIAYAALVAAHRGEFWPFSIYPMFSQGSQAWAQPLVREIPAAQEDISWNDKSRNELPGKAFALRKARIDPSDLSVSLNKSKQWNNKQIKSLRAYFQTKLEQSSFLIFKVHGQITSAANGSVTVAYTPFILIRKDTTFFNPRIYGSPTKQPE